MRGKCKVGDKWKSVKELIQGWGREECRDESRDTAPQVPMPVHGTTNGCAALEHPPKLFSK